MGRKSYSLATVAAEPERFEIDTAHFSVGFDIRHLAFAYTSGRFGAFTGHLEVTGGDLLTGRAEVEIDVASIDTGNSKRDAHLRAADFFDTARFPKARFVSTGEDPWGGVRAGYRAKTTLRRSDFAVGEASAMIGDEVHLQINLEVVRKAAPRS